jgi:hypothetical protein
MSLRPSSPSGLDVERTTWFVDFINERKTLCFYFSVNMSFGLFRNFLSKKTPPQISEISTPISVTKNVHVSYDPNTHTFHGLPSEWEEQVKNLFA